MEGELYKMAERTLHLAEDNNRILHHMRRAERWRNFFGVIRWLVVIAFTLGLYYYFQPVFDQLWKTYDELTKTIQSTKNVGQSLPNFQQVLENIKPR